MTLDRATVEGLLNTLRETGKFYADPADILEDWLRKEEALRDMGCLSDYSNCELRPTDEPCPRCAALGLGVKHMSIERTYNCDGEAVKATKAETALKVATDALELNCEYACDAKAKALADAARTHGEGYAEEMGRADAYADMVERLRDALAAIREEPQQ